MAAPKMAYITEISLGTPFSLHLMSIQCKILQVHFELRRTDLYQLLLLVIRIT